MNYFHIYFILEQLCCLLFIISAINEIRRYGWQTHGPPPGLSGRPGSGSYAGTAFYEGSHTGDR